jgi:CheY-like chemotaxis protein
MPRILILEDDPVLGSLLQKLIRGFGCDTVLAIEGSQAIEMYLSANQQNQPFAAVILDLTVPQGMGGKETMEQLLELDPQTVGIACSGYTSDPVLQNYRSYGFAARLCKPFRTSDLRAALECALGSSEALHHEFLSSQESTPTHLA